MTDNRILAELSVVPDMGKLSFKDVRYLLVRPDTIIDFQKAVEAEVGAERCAEMMMAGGTTGGSRSARRYREEFGLSDAGIVAFMCEMGRDIGWGRFELVELNMDTKQMVIEVTDSPFAESYGQAKHSVCHLTRGVLSGLAAGIFETQVHSAETACRAQADTVCRFELDGSARA